MSSANCFSLIFPSSSLNSKKFCSFNQSKASFKLIKVGAARTSETSYFKSSGKLTGSFLWNSNVRIAVWRSCWNSRNLSMVNFPSNLSPDMKNVKRIHQDLWNSISWWPEFLEANAKKKDYTKEVHRQSRIYSFQSISSSGMVAMTTSHGCSLANYVL